MSKAPNDIPLKFTNPDHEALMNILLTGTLLKRGARRFFRQTPISETQFNLLMALYHSDQPLSQNDLSERLLVDKSNVTAQIDRLQQSKLIQRNPVPDDRRSYHITLTQAGRRMVDTIEPAYQKLVAEVMDSLSGPECKSLIRLTRKVRQGLRSADTSYSVEG